MTDNKTHKDIFTLFDKKGQGHISNQLFGDYLRAIGYNPTNDLILQILKNDNNPDTLTFDEINKIINKNESDLIQTTHAKPDDFIKAFQVFDKENTGKVSVGDIRYMLTGLGEKLTDEEVDELLKGVQVDDDGMVNYKKFIEDIIRQ